MKISPIPETQSIPPDNFFDKYRLAIEFKPEDLWLGLFWKWKYKYYYYNYVQSDIWICLLPCLPLRITIRHNTSQLKEQK